MVRRTVRLRNLPDTSIHYLADRRSVENWI